MDRYEVIIVGAGPAGLSAALLLGRCRRTTLVIDSGTQRNRASRALHGFLTRDGIAPSDFLALGRQELEAYESVRLIDATVVDARRLDDGFSVAIDGGKEADCRMLLLATGVSDVVPHVPGLAACYGRSVFHCPYCDGWEQRDRRLAAYGRDAFGLALELRQWSNDVMLFTDGTGALPEKVEAKLGRSGVTIRYERVIRCECEEGVLRSLVLDDGSHVARDALFFKASAGQQSDLARRLGCEMTEDGLVKTGRFEITRVPGLFVAGDASRNVHLSIVAAAEGAQAAFAINTELLKADLP